MERAKLEVKSIRELEASRREKLNSMSNEELAARYMKVVKKGKGSFNDILNTIELGGKKTIIDEIIRAGSVGTWKKNFIKALIYMGMVFLILSVIGAIIYAVGVIFAFMILQKKYGNDRSLWVKITGSLFSWVVVVQNIPNMLF